MSQRRSQGTLWFEDFAAGQTYLTPARTITEADVVSFAGWSWDTNPVHTDAEFAARGRFGKPIAHGLLGMSVAMGLVSRLGIFEGSSIALLGVDDWQFRGPIVAGDTVRCEVHILAVRPTSNGEAGILDRQFDVLNQRDERVQQGRIGLMVARRPTS